MSVNKVIKFERDIKWGLRHPLERSHEAIYRAERVPALSAPPPMGTLNKRLYLPADWCNRHNQGNTPKCAAFAGALQAAIYNSAAGSDHYYDPHGLYLDAQQLDGVPLPHDGTTLEGVGQAGRLRGISEVVGGQVGPKKLENAWKSHYYASSFNPIGALRSGCEHDMPGFLGTAWTDLMNEVTWVNGQAWIMPGYQRNHFYGNELGLHGYTVAGCLDDLQAAVIAQTWGPEFGDNGVVLMPYTLIEQLITDGHILMFLVDRENTPPPPPPPPTDNATGFRVKTAGTNVRTGPGTSYGIRFSLPVLAELPVSEVVTGADGRAWYRFGNCFVASWVVVPLT